MGDLKAVVVELELVPTDDNTERYRVVGLKNTITPKVGSLLSVEEVEALNTHKEKEINIRLSLEME